MFANSHTSNALFLDFDGTLVEFADRPESVVVPPDLIILLETLYVRLDGALALISGRSIDSVDSLLNLPFIPIAGGHGAEWRLNGSFHSSVLKSEEFTHAVMLLTNFAKAEGLLFEHKSHSFAVHFRQKPEQKKRVDEFLEHHIEPLPGLRVIYGNCVREIQPSGTDKGKAVARFMSAPPFYGRMPIYIGDDTTDEDAFQWVNANHGASYKVGGGVTAAQYRLENVMDVRRHLLAFSAAGK